MLLLTDTILTVQPFRRIQNVLTDRTNDNDTHNLTKFELRRKESDYLENSTTTNKEKESIGQLFDDSNNTDLAKTVQSESHLKTNRPDGKEKKSDEVHKRELDDAIEYGLKAMQELLEVKEPHLYKMGLYLDENDPASHVAAFGAPTKKAIELSKIGYASIEASKKIAESYPENVSRQSAGFQFDTRLLQEECPLRGLPRCLSAARRYRTADGTCNNFNKPWRGSSFLPMQRFLPPVYEDGIQEVRRSEFNRKLPSAREVSIKIHRDKNLELPTVNLMFMQWGQLMDHDLVSTVKSRSFNGSVPRCCDRGGQELLPPELTHPSCLPIEVGRDDWFLAPLGIRCLEFIRSAPSTRIDCDLGWREQINQATSYLDASTIYGSDVETSDAMRTFRRGQLHYGRVQGREPLQPPDPPGGEICRSGALTSDCLQGGDGRLSEQPGLTALHTVWLRYHNRIAEILSQINRHWSDEKVYQETRRIVIGLIQHITYREFLPIVLGQEVLDLFELTLERKGFYSGYDTRINPTVANSFGTAAFRFGHSLVQNSFIRFDTKHRPLFNNVTLHEEQENVENIWSFGSLDRMLIGFCNQPSQRRDEFICDELTNHLFQSRGFPFGMDLAAINIQRGRDHGLPSYTSWREPCGLSAIKTWNDLHKIMNPDTVHRLKNLYEHINDIDLFTGGLAEKPVRGGLVGPTFACIIAQQFLNLRQGDRFWYENGGFESSFTPAQLQQIRHVTFAHVLCQTLTEIETIQPFVFLTADNFRNSRLACDSPIINNFDLSPWIERDFNEITKFDDLKRSFRQDKRRKLKRTTTKKPKSTSTTPPKVKIKNITTHTIKVETKKTYNTDSYAVNDIPQRPTFDSYNDKRTTSRGDFTYLFGVVHETTTQIPRAPPNPFEVNIKIQYYPPSTTKRPSTIKKKRKPTQTTRRPLDYNYPYYEVTTKPNTYSDDFAVYKPTYIVRPQQDFYGSKYEDNPFTTSKRPYIYRPNTNKYVYTTKAPQNYYNRRPPSDVDRDDSYDRLYTNVYSFGNTNFGQDHDDLPRPIKHYSIGHVEKITTDNDYDKFDFYSTKTNRQKTKFVKISSVKGEEYIHPSGSTVELHVAQREGDLELNEEKNAENVRLVDIDVIPGENKWLVYNATEEVMELMRIPDVNSDVSCSNELPRPMKIDLKPMTRRNLTQTN
ncbi:chorion peroxidase-like, partial [Asbolus verrucosus]